MKGVGPSQDPVLAEALADSQAGVVDQKTLKGVSAIAMELATKVRYRNELVSKLEEAEAEIKRLEERDLPAAMIDAGMKNFEMTDGSKISVSRRYLAGILVEKRPEAFKWLREHNHEALIKAEVVVPFAKGDVESADMLRKAITDLIEKRKARLTEELEKATAAGDKEEAIRLAEEIDAFNVEIGLEQSVHWQTLRAWVKEQVIAEEKAIEEGELDPEKQPDKLLPRDLFGVYVADVAEINIKKLSLKKE